MSRLFRVPNEWDYHGIGAVYVVADTAKQAVTKAKRLHSKKGREDRYGEYSAGSASRPDWDRIEEVEGGAFFATGCDD